MTLTILSASAGSGKTYRLTREFVRLILQEPVPGYVSSILAMTFTNKATNEMKERILQLLEKIASGNWEEDKNDILYPVMMNLKEEDYSGRARNVLKYLFKNYHQFSVSTLDSFFQQIIRQFQRELQLEQPFRVELDTSRVLRESINKFIDSLSYEDVTFQWIKGWIEENLSDHKTWDIRTHLQNLGKDLFKENVTSQWQESVDMQRMEHIQKSMRQHIAQMDQRVKAICQKLKETLETVGLKGNDFKYTTKSFISSWIKRERLIEYIEMKRLREAESTDTWFPKENAAQLKAQVYPIQHIIQELREEILNLMDNEMKKYMTYDMVIRHFRTYITLRHLHNAIKEYCKANDLLLLSEANRLVHMAVRDTDASLLYEKSGHRYKHIMVDEFQDTSQTQWSNIKPLFDHSLSNEWFGLIVGDIKQSIYRWRNGNWQIMHSGVYEDLKPFNEMISREILDTNWRSTSSIINFNNAFFQEAIQSAKNSITHTIGHHPILQSFNTVYTGIVQKEGRALNAPGSVEISLITKDKNEPFEKEKTAEDYPTLKDWLKDKILALYNGGYTPGDLCILVRKHQQASELTELFLELELEDGNQGRFDTQAENGYLLKYNPAVQWLILSLFLRNHPKNQSFTPAWYWYRNLVNGYVSRLDFFQQNEVPSYMADEMKHIYNTPLNTLTGWFTSLIQILKLEDNSPYQIAAFLDFVRDFELREGTDPILFESYWKDQENNLSATPDDSVQAIRIMTIHKSKGLEFPVVFIPYVDTPLVETNSYETIYVENDHDIHLKELGIFPVAFSKKLQETYFVEDYREEFIKKAIDQLNLLYVSLTRAQERIFIGITAGNEKVQSTPKVQDLFNTCKPAGSVEINPGCYRYGDVGYQSLKSASENTLEDSLILDRLYFREHPLKMGIWMKKPLTSLEEENAEHKYSTNTKPMNRGLVLHEILEKLKDRQDLSVAIQILAEDGVIPSDQRDSIENMLNELLHHPDVANWFTPGIEVVTEKEIIDVDGQSYRPDRIILGKNETILIDFKTGKRYKHYFNQIKKYIQLLNQMGLPNVKGKLVYINPVEVLDVTI
ncbi:MAG TPA: UvrD-helicase domain-containing protein [Saprospiraceae bacterium]|nr:UvrD-helicase domain-containing protein [Saprospiraceae bacterium]